MKSDSRRLELKPYSAHTITWVTSGGGRGDVEDGPGGDALPLGAEHAELRHAVQIGDDGGVRQGRELLVRPRVLLAVGGGPEDPEVPALRPELGHRPVVGDRPALLHSLPRRKLGPCCFSALALHRLTHDSILTDPEQCTGPGTPPNRTSDTKHALTY
ncbi:hypothetical protein GCM10020256_57460 [Streptomyces thermocoprophilus]